MSAMESRQKKGISIFVRILLVFMSVNIATSAILIVTAYFFSSGSIEKRTKESISQQVGTIRDNFEKQYGKILQSTIHSLAQSSALEDYLLASDTEKLVLSQKVEHLFVQTIKDFSSLQSIRFVDFKGDVKISVIDNSRRVESLNLKEPPRPLLDRNYPSLQASVKLFRQLETTPLLLSSGYMDWFIPPREIMVEGPFFDEDGTVSAVAAISKLDVETQAFGGILLIRQNLNDFFTYLRGMKFFDENPVWVFDAEGHVLQSPKNLRATFSPRGKLRAEFQGTVRLLDVEEGLLAFQDFSIVPGKTFIRIAVSIPSSLLMKDFKPVIKFFSVVMLASLVTVLIVALYVSRYLSKPIVELSSAASRFASGDLTARVNVRTTGEVQTLVESFNLMTTELRETMASRDASMKELVKEIAERKRAELELKQQAHELTDARLVAESASLAKSQFLANMSHEIRTPMNGILGMTELLLHTSLQEKQRNFLKSVHSSGTTLLEVINEILDFSKIEAGQLQLETINFDLHEPIDDVVGLLAESAHKKGLELVCQLDEDLPNKLRGDPNRLRQIITNLVGNAIKFTERGEVAVLGRLVEESEDDVLLRFEVSDTGIGIPTARQDRIFDTFTQADSSTTRKYGGTGLGLPIAKQLSEKMGGQLGVESKPGQGSTFWFTVRLKKQPFSTQAAEEISFNLRGCRVLVVDDNETNRTILDHQVIAWGMRNESAIDGPHALEILREAAKAGDPYQLAILDMYMPGMDGLELTRAIKADATINRTHLVMLTSVGVSLNSEELIEAGVTSCLDKPVRASDLYNCVIKAVGNFTETSSSHLIDHDSADPTALLDAYILVVEDNPVNQDVCVCMLQELGYKNVDVAANGLEALDRVSQKGYSLVLMDCQMPGMDGFEATRLIRQREENEDLMDVPTSRNLSHIPIIALTANAQQADREMCLAAKMDDYLSKPFTLEQLRGILKRWLLERQASDSAGGSLPTSRVPINSRDAAETNLESTGSNGYSSVIDREALDDIRALQRPGMPDLVGKVINKYLSYSPTLLQALRQAASEGNAPAVQEAAHSLKSSSANLGATRLAAQCKELELLARANTIEPIQEHLHKLETEYEAVRIALSAELQESA